MEIKELSDLVKNTIIFEYHLPNSPLKIEKTIFTKDTDHCFSVNNSESLVDIIYKGIVLYSFSEYELNNFDFKSLHSRALLNKIRWNENQTKLTKKKYGFYGEILLHLILQEYFSTKVILARGYFYNPTAKTEVTGYDSYHLIESNNKTELWFGEVKFYQDFKGAVSSIIKKLKSSINDEYLKTNILSFDNHIQNADAKNSQILKIIESWRRDPTISISDELQKYNMELIYPALVLYDDKSKNYNESINELINHINDEYSSENFNISIQYKIFFILIPLSNVSEIKEKVIECIDLKKPVI